VSLEKQRLKFLVDTMASDLQSIREKYDAITACRQKEAVALQTLRRTSTALEDEKRRYQEQMDILVAEKVALATQCESLENQVLSLRGLCETATARVRQLEGEPQLYAKKMVTLRDDCVRSLREAVRREQELKQTLDGVTRSLADTEVLCEQSRVQVATVEERLVDVRGVLVEREKRIEHLEQLLSKFVDKSLTSEHNRS
jgi:chromosome segregation ATPase